MSLIERLEAAEVGSRELDRELNAVLLPDEFFAPAYRTFQMYSRSLDAALQLSERALPGWLSDINEHKGGRWFGCVSDPHRNKRAKHGLSYAYAPTPALALCIAILKAKETK